MNKFFHSLSDKSIKILVAGAGGLGCEIIKNLIKMKLELHIIIVDYDTVSETNLNRLFCFRINDVERSKVVVISEYFNKFKHKSVTLEPLHANLFELDISFYWKHQFTVIMSGLDNGEARDHLNKIAVFLNIPMIDAGTSGYNGQTQGYIRFGS